MASCKEKRRRGRVHSRKKRKKFADKKSHVVEFESLVSAFVRNRIADKNGHLRVAGERLKRMGQRGRKPGGCLWDAESLRRGPRGSRAGGPAAIVGVNSMFGGIGSWDTVARCGRISSGACCGQM